MTSFLFTYKCHDLEYIDDKPHNVVRRVITNISQKVDVISQAMSHSVDMAFLYLSCSLSCIALASPKSKAALGRVADGTRRGGIAVDTYIVTAT